MAFNYTNQSLENIFPLFGAIANCSGNAISNHPSFINQLAAAITTANAVNVATTSTISAASSTKREVTPEPPPAPKFSTFSPPKMKPNQGTAPMDLENDSEVETQTSNTNTMVKTSAPAEQATRNSDKVPLNVHDPNMFLNGLMSANMNASGYMFFPTATTTTAATPPASSASSMMMDPSAMMAALQQMQQGAYAGYNMATDSAIDSGQLSGTEPYMSTMKEVIKTKSCILFPPNPKAPPPTIRERPSGCRTIFVGGLPENITEEMIREIFESCGEITTLRMSKKNFCHIRYRHEASIDRAIYLSGYRVRISNLNEPANFGRLHVDYALARDDQYDFECKQRQLQREQRHRERMSLDRLRSQSPPPMPHYTDHEATLVAENLRNNETFVKGIQTISVWLERGDCTKRNANIFYSMIQSTHAHVRRLYTDKQQLEENLRKARECYRKQMLTMSTQFTQIEKVFSAASHKKVWDHFTKAQRKNIDQWKKLATELRSVQIEDDEMEMSDDDRDYPSSNAKRARYDSESLKDENDTLRCQLEAIRNEMSLERTDIKYDSDFREKQIKVLQETIRNMQTQLLQTKMREQKDAMAIEQLERRLKEAGVKQLLLKTRIKETSEKLRDREASSVNSETSDVMLDEHVGEDAFDIAKKAQENKNDQMKINSDDLEIIDIDVYKSDEDVKIIEKHADVVEIHELEESERVKSTLIKDTAYSRGKTQPKDVLSIKEVPKIKVKNNTEETKALENNVKSGEFTSLALFEAKIIGLAVAFLVVQPHGVCSDSVCSYINNMMQSFDLQTKALDGILEKYTNLFRAEMLADAETVVKVKWKFCGFVKTTKGN